MKINKIVINNLASLEGEHVIDFTVEPLASSNLFLLTGPTGAGKSTILDAVCLALYNQTPRYKNAPSAKTNEPTKDNLSQSDVRSILRDGAIEGSAAVFFIGLDKVEYCATWSVNRAYKKVDGNIKDSVIELQNVATNAKFPGKKTETLNEIKRLVGLEYEQFTKSVLLAQGDFAAFLKASETDQATLLEKLTGTGIYSEISIKIFEHYREATNALKHLESQFSDINLLDEPTIAQKQNEIEQFNNQLLIEQKQLDVLKKEQTWFQDFEALNKAYLNAQEQLEHAKIKQAENAANTAILQQLDAIQNIKPQLTAYQNIQSQLDKRIAEKSVLEQSINTENEKLTESKHLVQNTQDALTLANQNFELAKVDLEHAQKLDFEIEILAPLVKQSETKCDADKEELNKKVELLQSIFNQSETITSEIEEHQSFLSQNENRKIVAEHKNVIVEQLQNASITLNTLQAKEQQLFQLNNSFETIAARVFENDGLYNEAFRNVESLKAKQNEMLLHFNTNDFEKLIADKDLLVVNLQVLKDAFAVFKNVAASQIELSEKQSKLQALKSNQVSIETTLNNEKALLSKLEVEKQAAQSILDKAQLEASKHVVDLRNSLEPGEPCPVCGSEHHPYAAEISKPVEQVMQVLKEAETKATKAFEQSLATVSRIEQDLQHTIGLIETFEIEINSLSSTLQIQIKEWQELKAQLRLDIPLNSNEDFNASIEKEQSNLNEIQEKIKVQNQYRIQLEQLRIDLQHAENALSKLQNAQFELKTEQQNVENNIKNEQASIQMFNEQLDKVQQQLNPYFTNNLWFENWKQNNESVLQLIETFAQKWSFHTAKLSELKGKLNQLESLLDSNEQLKLNLEKQYQQSKQAFADRQQELLNLQTQRQSIFNGASVKSQIALFENAIDLAQMQLNHQQKSLTNFENALTILKTKLEGLNNLIVEQNQEFNTNKGTIAAWLNQFNQTQEKVLNFEDLNALMQYDEGWIASQRQYQSIIANELSSSLTIISERELQLKNHQTKKQFDHTLDELNELLNTLIETINTLNQQRNDLQFELRTNEQKKERLGDLQFKIEHQKEIAENWDKLNSLIGSRDGNAFRKIAQQYTLDVLVSHANQHLATLTNRYKLKRIPGSLSLLVVDKEMGDEVRYVHSLSGGESFLASLSLALGLASLSTNKMQVESLFIDEGFGTLDQQTLNIVIDALESLSTSAGRKVGIISHVQEMKERIATQIVVSKQHNGKSKILIESTL